MASRQVIIIITTLKMAAVSFLDKLPERGLMSAIRINKVRITAKWAIMRLPVLIPHEKINKKRPAIAGIKAVAEGSDELK